MEKLLADIIIECFQNGGKLLIFGNGGSSAEASHFAGEFIGINLPAIALNDPAILTAIANDFGYSEVFSRQIRSIGRIGDIGIGISTSGKSKNVIKGLREASKIGLLAIEWPRGQGKTTGEIQDYQLKLIHQVFNWVRKWHEDN